MKYSVVSDIKFVCESFGISNDEFAKEIGIASETLSRLLNERIDPSNELLEKIYFFINKKIPDFNRFKVDAYKKHHDILLFHGAKSEIIENISLEHSKKHVDFGCGFYMGDNYEQSLDFVSQTKDGSIYVLETNYKDLKVLNLDIGLDWMLLIALNRGKLEEYKNSPLYKRLNEILKKYDVIIAPIADNRMFTTIDDFVGSAITSEQAIHALRDLSLGKQYVFRSEKAVKKLNILDRLFVTSEERQIARKAKIEKIIDSDDFIKNAYKENIRKGKYITEVFDNAKDDK